MGFNSKQSELFVGKTYDSVSLFHIASVHPAEKWVPSLNKAVLRACALYAASCSGISRGVLKRFSCVRCLLGKEGRVNISVDTRL